MSVPHLGDQYYRARNQVAVSAGLLLLLRIGGLATDRPIPVLNLAPKDSGKLSLILLACLLYSLVHLIIAWTQSHPLRRKRRASRIDLTIAVTLALLSIGGYYVPFGNWGSVDWTLIKKSDVLWMLVLLGLGVLLSGFMWAWLTVPFVIRSKQEAIRMGVHQIPVAVRATMNLSIPIFLVTLALVAYKSRGYANPFVSIGPWPVLIPICVGVLAFVWGFLVSPSVSKAKRRSLRQKIVDLKAAYLKHDQTYQKYGWDRPAIHQHSPLFIAAKQGDCLRIHDLIQSGAGLSTEEHLGWTPLMIAAANGHEEAVHLLIRLGADPNGVNSRGRTPLMFASRYGFQRIAEALIQAGADVNRVDTEGSPNALAIASREGHIDIVRLLLAHGANRDIADSTRKTAVDLAKESGHAEIAALFHDSK